MRMTEAMLENETAAKKPSRLPLIIGLVLALAGGGGGFLAVQSGLLGGLKPPMQGPSEAATAADESPAPTPPLPDVAFIDVPPVTISLGPNTQAQHLRFRASLEVPSAHATEIENIMPRVQDVLNSYLRALEPADIEAPGALLKLRGQMLRRVRLVAGEGRVRDLLVMEFVLN
jgi:flagellar FliL protein